jgi:hypothetical protein
VHQTAQAAVQRVCPHCARISYDSGRRCPYCGRGFRRSVVPAIAALLAVFAVVVLGGMYLMLVAAGNELDRRLDREVSRVEREFEANLDSIREDVREELDARLPANGAVPTPTP